jgi:glycine betaine/proline transport system substrate-binding protein
LFFLPLAACSDNDKKTVTLVYTGKAESVALTFLAASIMDKEYSYNIETVRAESDGKAFDMLAGGEADIFLSARLPLHADLIHAHNEKITSIGIIYPDARNGFVVPSYAGIDSIAELNDIKAAAQGRITGISAGSNIMEQTGQAIETYHLDFELQSGSREEMLTALQDAAENNEIIVITGWTPHWMFDEWDLKFLEDPLEIFGEPQTIEAYAAKGLSEKYPEVGGFLGKYSFEEGEIASLMKQFKDIPDGADLMQIPKDWISANTGLVDSWL